LAQFDMREYARRGAAARVEELNSELATIYNQFPDLRRGRGPTRGRVGRPAAAAVGDRDGDGQTRTRRRRTAMTAAQRRAVSLRMKKYWAQRRKGKAAGKSSLNSLKLSRAGAR
jgi:hypothetical protein